MTRTDEILGPVRLCPRCREEWPYDVEFWYFDRRGKSEPYCRACCSERNRAAWARRRAVAA